MICESIRQRLLHCERPGRPPADVQPHLAGCAACRAVQRRLTRVERRITEVEAPQSEPPPELIQQILHGPPPLPGRPGNGPKGGAPPWWVGSQLPAQPGNATPWWVSNPDSDRLVSPRLPGRRSRHAFVPHNDRARPKVALAFALTLGLAVFSLCWGLWSQRGPETVTRSTPVASRRARLDNDLAVSRTPNERIRIIAEFTESLVSDARGLAGTPSPSELPALAALYVEVVRDRLPAYALSIPREERAAVLGDLAHRLSRTESNLSQLANAQETSPSAATPLRDMANAAREGQDMLWKLQREV